MSEVKVLKRTVVIPTYKTGEPCKHPMFLEKRVYQGSSGRVYPHPVTESVSDERSDCRYTAVFLENEYLSVMILPEIGGKIQRIFDKTNGYDAVYYNEVIKPALVGLTGPWAAGGIEFSWPQHHRPSAFESLNYYIEKSEDGSATVWCGEIENMYHTKGMAGITLHPGKAYVEVKGQLYNPTEIPQTFAWWANPTVAVNENTKTIFPPDVHAVMDRYSSDVSKFPIATGSYYSMDYSEGVDISRYKNIPIPTAYMACHTDYDFVGNYDFGASAGLIHLADHHIAPGKKQWTWGSGNFGKAWDRNLTDENGSYAELMAGVYTDAQPGFAFLMPYEEKTFKQYFIPYKGIGEVKNAALEVMANLEVRDGKAHIMLYVPCESRLSVLLNGTAAASYMKERVNLSPYNIYDKWVEIDEDEAPEGLKLIVRNRHGETILQYTPVAPAQEKIPEPAKAIPPAKEIATKEELYLAAVHLEQYRHATRRPEEYYLEGLRRSQSDIRMNNGYGKLLYKKGLFEEAEKHFRISIERMTMFNPTPYDCEPYYNLGLTLKMQRKYDEAYDAFYKSVWDGKMQDKGYYQLACVSAKQSEFGKALEFVEQSINRGNRNMRARHLRSALLRHCGRTEEAIEFTKQSVQIDPLDFAARYELFLLTRDFALLEELKLLMRDSLQNYLEISISYAEANLYTDASNVLALIADTNEPMLHYYMAYYSNSSIELEIAQNSHNSYAFPNRLQDIPVLNYAIKNNTKDWFPHYALGNLYYDKCVWFKAIKCWNDALKISPRNSAVMRNLAIANYNKLNEKDEALRLMERAALYAPEDARIYYELDMLRKLMNHPIKKRLMDMIDKLEMVETRDDLYTEYITLLNNERYYEYALREIKRHIFHPWDGGEGKITSQYRRAHMGMAREYIKDSDYEEAINHLEAALEYPENLGEGKLITCQDTDIYYYMGIAYENVDKITAIEYFNKSIEGEFTLDIMRNYKDTPPELFMLRTLAYGKLGNERKMKSGFNMLIDYSEKHIDDKPEIDYFAASLPDFYVFDGDLEQDNFVHCCYLAALGYHGKGMKEKSAEFIELGLEKNCSHQGLLFLKNLDMPAPKLKQEDPTLLRVAKWNTST